MVGKCAIHDDIGRQAAIAQFAFCPVYAAGARTKGAGGIHVQKGLNDHDETKWVMGNG